MNDTSTKLLGIEEFLAKYGDDPRYELADGEPIDMEPTGSHQTVGGKLAARLNGSIERLQNPWFIPLSCLVRPFADTMTVRRPDIIVLDETLLAQEAFWDRDAIITNGSTVKLIVEVVSTNWETDYARKLEEYALLGIAEYWIVDYQGLGGTAFIGKPKQPTFTVCHLADDDYQQSQFRLGEKIISPTFPAIDLRLNDILPR